MALPDGYRMIRLDDDSRLDEVLSLDVWAFPSGIAPEDLRADVPIPWGRTWAVEPPAGAGGDLAGMFGIYGLSGFPVPGAEVSCGWLTWVCVHPGHRRRGILRAMIEQHLADCRDRGEAVSGLTASEAAIYGRFGFGAATPQVSLTIPRGAQLRPVAGADAYTVQLVEWDGASHGDLVAGLHRDYARVPEGLGRPGWATWETPALRARVESDRPGMREGREVQRLAIVRDGEGRPRGYARFRRQLAWQRDNADGTLHVRDAVALDAAAAHRLWSVLLDLDLIARIEAGPLPVDDPILALLVDPRAAQPVTNDIGWIRIIDLPRALAERRYAAPVDVVLEVTDAMLPENAGRWRVVADAWGHAEVERSVAGPDLVLDVRELGSVHLGTVSLAALAQAGLVEARSADALARAATAWSWPVRAGQNWVF